MSKEELGEGSDSIQYAADLTVVLPGEIKSIFILWRSTVLKDIDKVDTYHGSK